MQGNLGEQSAELAVRFYGCGNVVHLGGHDDVGEPTLLEVPHERDGALDELLGLCQILTGVDLAVERAGVDADANGDRRLSGCIDAGVHAVPSTDIARVKPKGGSPTPSGLDRKAMVKVDVGDNGKGRLGADFLKPIEDGCRGNSNANDLAARFCQLANLH